MDTFEIMESIEKNGVFFVNWLGSVRGINPVSQRLLIQKQMFKRVLQNI